jgi:ketosteroid isomerase-like protein
MRLRTTLTAFIALGLGGTVFAQEEQTQTPAQEQPPTTIQETATTPPPAEASPAAESKPMSSPAASPAAKPEKAAAPAKKAASPAPTAAMGGKKMSVEAALKDNENRWEAAIGRHDPSVTQPLVANDFSGVYWDGKVMRKSDIISQIRKDKDTYKSAVNERLDVHMYGKGVAVVIGTAREKGTTKDGKAFDRQYRFTDTWVERNGQWQCVSSHVMKTRG